MPGPDFSPFARQYAETRPGYPPALYEHLASLVASRERAWDAATGNGQAATDLAAHFEVVVATDRSAEQIRHARPHPQIEYRVAPAEASGLPDASVDIVTVAAALHWLDLDAFYAEVRRVLRPGGIFAAWTYHVCHVEPPFTDLFQRYYDEVLRRYFEEAVRYVDERFETIPLPGEPLRTPSFHVAAGYTLDGLEAYVRSWSGVQRCLAEGREDPIEWIRSRLEPVWGDRSSPRTLRWPIYLKVVRPD